MKSSQQKKAAAAGASSKKITDFFPKPLGDPSSEPDISTCSDITAETTKPSKPVEDSETPLSASTTSTFDSLADPLKPTNAATSSDTMDTDAMQVDNHQHSDIPLFDPSDDHEDHLMDADLREDLEAVDALKLAEQLSNPTATKAAEKKLESVKSTSSLSSSSTSGPRSKLSGKPLVFEDDDDDLELLLNANYDFIGLKSKESPESKQASDAASTTPASSTTSRSKATKSKDSLASLTGSSKRATKHSYSLDSLLQDKVKREKQIQEASAIETLMEAAEAESEISSPGGVASKYLPQLMDDLEQSSTTSSAPKRKRKTRIEDVSVEDDDDVMELIDEEETLDPRKSEHAIQEKKRRMENFVIDSMKGGSVESLVLFDSVEVIFHDISPNFEFPADDKIGDIVSKALKEFLLSGALSRTVDASHWYFPDSLSSWLFETACYATSEFTASAAAKSLNHYFEHFSSEQGTWIITPFMFKEVLASYGFRAKLFAADSDEINIDSFVETAATTRANQSMESDQFESDPLPAFKLYLCAELYVSCLTNRSTHYPSRSVEDAFQLFVKLSIDPRVVYATGDLLAKCVSKLARFLATKESERASSGDLSPSQYILNHLSAFAGSNPVWQDALICSPNSALFGSISAPGTSGCPTREGLEFLAHVRRELAARCVVKAGVSGGFRKTGDDAVVADSDETTTDSTTDTSLAALTSIVSQYKVPPAKTDYVRLASRIQILAASVGGLVGIRQSPKESKELESILGKVHGSINDTQHLALDRIKAKETIHDLKTFIDLGLPKNTKQQMSLDGYLKQ
ncbi:hypothetical protein HDU98_000619 [Podochytrium sp. JEL0797]|nr:hypothetical protein HDU98_000619 [Podochytrium sp. JEL0797]